MITEKEYLEAKKIVDQYKTEQLNKHAVISSAKCCDNEELETSYENNSNADGSGTLGVTRQILKCKNCGKHKWF